MTRYLTLLIFLSFSIFGQAQPVDTEESNVYDIRLASIKIGELVTTKRVKDSVTIYTMESSVNFWILTSIHVHHRNTSVYHKRQFISSISSSATNKGDFLNSIVWEKDC